MRITNTGSIAVGTTDIADYVGDVDRNGKVVIESIDTNTTWASASSTLVLRNNNNTTNTWAKLLFSSKVDAGATKTAVGAAISAQFSDQASRYNYPDTDLVFHTATGDASPVERMRITEDGYIGIGTATPQNKLDVEGGAVIGATYSGTNTAPTNGLLVEGNVGIGMTTVDYKLDVTGTARFSQPVIVGTPTAATHATTKSYVDSILSGSTGVWIQSGSYLYASSTSWNVGVGTTTPATLFTVATTSNAFNVLSSGRVGIGTTNPGNLLSVGNATLTYQATYNGIDIANTGSNSILKVGQDSSHQLQFRWDYNATAGSAIANLVTYGYSNPLRIDASTIALQSAAAGGVGIGTTVPQNKLDVEGGAVIGASYSGTNAAPTNGLLVQGNVGIGTTDPGTYALSVVGSGYSSGGWEGPTSDIRLKKDVTTLSNVLEKLQNVRGVAFDWRFDEFPEKRFSQDRQIGVIAQELEKAFPELVGTDQEGYKFVKYNQLSGVLLQAIQEQQVEIKDLEKRIKKLENGK